MAGTEEEMMLRVSVLGSSYLLCPCLLQHGTCSETRKSLISSPVPCTPPGPADPDISICLSSGMPATEICRWSNPCTELSTQSVTEFICAKISIQAYTWDPDRPSNKYYWLVIIIFYCWYAEGCGALQLDFYTVHWKICLIIVFILAARHIFIAGWG